MWSVFDLRCDGRYDPSMGNQAPVLSWRMGSDRTNAEQASCRIVVTSMFDGSRRWDTGRIRTSSNAHRYRGASLVPGETCVWFVSTWDDEGARADGVPASFAFSPDEPDGHGAHVEERVGFVWTSDGRMNAELEERLSYAGLNDVAWREAVGLSGDEDMRRIRIRERDICGPFDGLGFVQASLKSACGLLLVRWDREASGTRLRMSLPPGTVADVDAMKEQRTWRSGRHERRAEA